MVKFLISLPGVSVSAATEFGFDALQTAIYKGNNAMVKLLLTSIKDSNNQKVEQQYIGMTPLMMASHIGKPALVNMLLEAGYDCNYQHRLNGWTALMYACGSSITSSVIVRQLIEHGADADVKDVCGKTVMDVAVARGNMKIVHLLSTLTNKPVPDIADNKSAGQSANERHEIFDMIVNGDFVKLETLIRDDSSSVAQRDPNDGLTPLMLAVIKHDLNMVKLIVNSQASLNQKDDNEWTALHYAAYYNHPDTVDYLISIGAQLGIDFNQCKGDRKLLRVQLQNMSTNDEIVDSLEQAILHTPSAVTPEPQGTSVESVSLRSRQSSSNQPSEALGWFRKVFHIATTSHRRTQSETASAKPDLVRIPKNLRASKLSKRSQSFSAQPAPIISLANPLSPAMFPSALRSPDGNKTTFAAGDSQHRRQRSDISSRSSKTPELLATPMEKTSNFPSNPTESKTDLDQFLENLKLPQYLELLFKNEIRSMNDLAFLAEADLQVFGIHDKDHIRTIQNACEHWRKQQESSSMSAYHYRSASWNSGRQSQQNYPRTPKIVINKGSSELASKMNSITLTTTPTDTDGPMQLSESFNSTSKTPNNSGSYKATQNLSASDKYELIKEMKRHRRQTSDSK